MALSVRDLWTTLIRLGLLDPAAAKQLALRAKAQAPAASDDPVALAKYLVAQRVLTRFQAHRLLNQRAGELRQGDYLVLAPVDRPPLTRWFRARHLPTAVTALVYRGAAASDAANPVDLAWLRAHAAVVADGLQPLQLIQLSGTAAADDGSWRGLIVSALPAGQTLARWLQTQGPLEPAAALALGRVLAGATAALHAGSLLHGEIRPERVWIGEDSSVYLLRCGSGPPIAPSAARPPYDWFDDDGQAAAFASPQRLSGEAASVQDDVYSLGALLYNATTGQPVTPGVLPQPLREAVQAGPSGDPLHRVLAAALAPEPAQRFADIPGLLRALDAVSGLLDPPASSPAPGPAAPVAASPAITPNPPATAASTPATAPSTPVAAANTKVAAAVQEPVHAAPRADNQVAASPPQTPVASANTPSQPGRERPSRRSELEGANHPAASQSHPAASDNHPAASDNHPAASESHPAARENHPAASSAKSQTPDPGASGTESPPQLVTPPSGDPPRRRVRKRTRRSRRGPILIGSSAVAILLLVLALLLRSAPEDPASRPTPRPVGPSAPVAASSSPGASAPGQAARGGSAASAVSPAAGSAANDTGGFTLVRDERLLWAPPWPADNRPPPLDLVTPGSQVIIALRPRQLLADDHAANWTAWFGPELEPSLQSLQRRCGVSPQQIERLVIGLHPGDSGQPSASLAVWLAEPMALDTLLQTWQASPSQTAEGKTLFAAEDPGADAYFVPGESPASSTTISAFAVGSIEQMRLVAEIDGGPVPLPRPLELAWSQSSDDAEVVAMASPNFLFADGRKLLQQFAPRAAEPLQQFLIPDVTAAILSFDSASAWYGELRLVPGGTATAPGLLNALQQRIADLPAQGERFVVQSEVPASWRALAIRLPQYLRTLADHTRFGISESLPTANFYLPAEAAPQLSLASLLALASPPASSAPAVAATSPAPQPLSIDQLLDRNLSISFDQESLEFAVSMIAEEFASSLPAGVPPPKISIIGGDLEKSGITQNQQVRDFQMRDVPLRQVLTRLVLEANPDKTATGPADEKQALLWVVAPDATPENPALLITTRPQAQANGLALPREFTTASAP